MWGIWKLSINCHNFCANLNLFSKILLIVKSFRQTYGCKKVCNNYELSLFLNLIMICTSEVAKSLLYGYNQAPKRLAPLQQKSWTWALLTEISEIPKNINCPQYIPYFPKEKCSETDLKKKIVHETPLTILVTTCIHFASDPWPKATHTKSTIPRRDSVSMEEHLSDR